MEANEDQSKASKVTEGIIRHDEEEEESSFIFSNQGSLNLASCGLAKLTAQQLLEQPSTSHYQAASKPLSGCSTLKSALDIQKEITRLSQPSTSKGTCLSPSNVALIPSTADQVLGVPKSISQVRCESDLLRSVSADRASSQFLSGVPSEKNTPTEINAGGNALLSKPCSGTGITESVEDELQFIVDDDVSLGSTSSHSPPSKQVPKLLGESESRCENFCRICHDLDQDEALISPCKCRGSLSLVHTSCLQHWLAESDSSHCELCGFKYKTKRSPKYSMIGSIVAWFKSCRRERREVILDVLATITFAPMAGIGTYIGLLMAEALNLDDDNLPNVTMGTLTGRVAALSIISLMTTLDVAYATWAAIRLQYHINSWYSWYRRNSDVTLIEIQPPVK